jgi:GMP reductase
MIILEEITKSEVKDIEDTYFYDIEVDVDHSYCVGDENIIVHNCRTRTKSGVGVPQVTAIQNCIGICQEYNIKLISDGGCKYEGDVAKALAVGADGVMLGTMLSGTDEGGGKIIEKHYLSNEVKAYDTGNQAYGGSIYRYDNKYVSKKFMTVYGMSSRTANEKNFGGLKDYRTSEGITALVPYKGSMHNVVKDILGGLRSSCSYSDSFTLEDFMSKVKYGYCNSTHSTFLENFKIGD